MTEDEPYKPELAKLDQTDVFPGFELLSDGAQREACDEYVSEQHVRPAARDRPQRPPQSSVFE